MSKAQTVSGRRQADRQKRARRRARIKRRKRDRRHFKFKVKVVRTYRAACSQYSEKRAIELTLARFRPTEEWHFPLSASTIRRWNRQVKKEGWASLRPKSRRPKTIHYKVPEILVGIIFTLRSVLGWGGHRIAAELKKRQIGQVSGKTVYKIFDRLGLPVKIYALKGRSDGIAYTRYEKAKPNAQWHIDLKHIKLKDGTKAYICVIVDDYSRYAVAAVAGTNATTNWVSLVAKEAIQRAGKPQQIVSDNGREFVSVWEDSLTRFGQLLAENGVEHLTTAPYYPQGNGKAEAFIKILGRELLKERSFESLEDVQKALDSYLTYYNNYRLHSALAWQAPVTRYTGRDVRVHGLAAIPGLEKMAASPQWGPSYADPPPEIHPDSASRATALVPLSFYQSVQLG